MFFDDPEAAFQNLAELTVEGGRLCVAVWADRGASPLFELPLTLALDELADPRDRRRRAARRRRARSRSATRRP